jgi:hypothetical protein
MTKAKRSTLYNRQLTKLNGCGRFVARRRRKVSVVPEFVKPINFRFGRIFYHQTYVRGACHGAKFSRLILAATLATWISTALIDAYKIWSTQTTCPLQERTDELRNAAKNNCGAYT